MNLTEALKALNEGKKIRRKGWKSSYQLKGWFLESCPQFNSKVLTLGGKWCAGLTLTPLDILGDDWEVEDGYITKDEKEYLENFLRIYRDDYEFSFEKVMRNGHLYLKISFVPFKFTEDDAVEIMLLPLFGLNKPMFEGLEKDILYTGADLKLFHRRCHRSRE